MRSVFTPLTNVHEFCTEKEWTMMICITSIVQLPGASWLAESARLWSPLLGVQLLLNDTLLTISTPIGLFVILLYTLIILFGRDEVVKLLLYPMLATLLHAPSLYHYPFFSVLFTFTSFWKALLASHFPSSFNFLLYFSSSNFSCISKPGWTPFSHLPLTNEPSFPYFSTCSTFHSWARGFCSKHSAWKAPSKPVPGAFWVCGEDCRHWLGKEGSTSWW